MVGLGGARWERGLSAALLGGKRDEASLTSLPTLWNCTNLFKKGQLAIPLLLDGLCHVWYHGSGLAQLA